MDKKEKMDPYDILKVAYEIMNATSKNGINCAVANVVDKQKGYTRYAVIITNNPHLLQLTPECILKENKEGKTKIEIVNYHDMGRIPVMTIEEYTKLINRIRV